MNARPDLGYVPEIEQEVLGALLSGANFPIASANVETGHFIHAGHKMIFEACRKSYNASGSCKYNLAKKFMDIEALEKAIFPVKAQEYLTGLIADCTYGAPRLAESAKKVVEQWARLALSEEFGVLSEAANDVSADLKQIIIRAGERQDEILSHLRHGSARKTRFTVQEAAQNAIKASQNARENGTGLTGIDWALADVNRLTGGLQRRDLTLMAARPSMGKTTVAMSCALRSALKGFCFGFISLEMDAEKVAARQLSDLLFDDNIHIPYTDILRGSVPSNRDNALELAADRLTEIPLYIEDQSGLTMADIRIKLESLLEQASKAGHSLDGLIVDHIGLIKPSNRYGGQRVNEMTEISAGLKTMAREYDIAVLALSQLSRGVENRENKRPMLSDLRDSGSLEQDADAVIFLYRHAYYLERELADDNDPQKAAELLQVQNELDFIIAKNRNGPVTTVKLFADMAVSAIRNAA